MDVQEPTSANLEIMPIQIKGEKPQAVIKSPRNGHDPSHILRIKEKPRIMSGRNVLQN